MRRWMILPWIALVWVTYEDVSAITSDLIQIMSITPVLLISLFLVNLVLFYEFLRADPFSEQVRKGLLLIMMYGAVLLWIYDPIVLGTIILCVTLWGMIVPL